MKRLMALMMAGVLTLSLAGCGSSTADTSAEADTAAETTDGGVTTDTGSASDTGTDTEYTGADTLVFGEDSGIEGKFNWLFYQASTDDDVCTLIFQKLLGIDREAAVVEKGIEGEVREYNGTEYTYYGITDVDIVENADGSVDYNFTMRDDIVFSDGTPATIDDFIFPLYVALDPTYDGIFTLNSLSIKGLAEYTENVDSLFNLLVAAGEDNTDFTYWDEATQEAFWADLAQAGEAFAQEIVDYCAAAGYAAGSDDVATAAGAWGFSLDDGATAADFFDLMVEEYGGDYASLSDVESAGSTLFDLMEDYASYSIGVSTGDSAENISGIVKTGDYSMTVTLTKIEATALLALADTPLLSVAYYGDGAFDYDNNYFGFTKGDLSGVKSHTTQPLGSGAYTFVDFENGTVHLTANPYYYKGEPKIKNINIVEMADADKIPALQTGTADIVVPSYSADAVAQISEINGNDSVTGDVITTTTVYNNGYGYIGINANNVRVGGDAGSDESKNLRKAFATIFAAYRDEAINSYYGELAEIINYPITNTSWAAPRTTDEGYKIAFSVDVDGNDIYSEGMTNEERYAAAIEAALGFFEAAGYTVEDGVVTAAPEGAKLEYNIMIPANGTGDHPNYMILSGARDALETIGITLTIRDLSDGTVTIGNELNAGTAEMWTMAWGGSTDPDMYQIYYSDVANGGRNAGGSSYYYAIADEELDELILLARNSLDTGYRKTIYKEALDIVVDWATEVPIYQRLNAYCFSTERVNMDTVTPDITTFWNWMNDIELLEMN